MGLRVASKAGTTARVGLRGRKALLSSLDDVARGGVGAVRDPDTGRLIRTIAEGLEDVPPTNKALSEVIGGRLLGPVTSGRVGRALSRVGGEVEHGGGMLAELLDDFGSAGVRGAQAQEVRNWMAKYGAGTGGGLRIGRNEAGKLTVDFGRYAPGKPIATSTVAHVPFTEFGIHVPAFTGEGKAIAQGLRIATAPGVSSPADGLGPALTAAAPIVREMQDFEAAMRQGIPTEGVDPQQHLTGLRAKLDDLLRFKSEEPIEAATPKNVGELLALKKVWQEADAAQKLTQARMTGGPLEDQAHAVHDAMERYAQAVRGSVKQFATTQDEATQGLVARMLGMDDDRIGASLLTPFRTVARASGDPGIAADILNRIDSTGKGAFGQPVGLLRSQTRALRNGLLPGAREAYIAAEDNVRRGIVGALQEAGLDTANLENYRRGYQVMLAHMFAERNKMALDAGQDAVFFHKKFGSDEPAEWVKLLQGGQEDGLFTARNGVSASDRLRELARQQLGMLDRMGDYEKADDILGFPMAGYIPAVPTPAAARQIALTNRQRVVPKPGSAAGVRQTAQREAFQKPKTTMQYRFKSESGGEKRFFEKDRWVQNFPEEAIEEIAQEAPKDAADLRALKETIDEYDRLAADPAWAEKHAPRQTDPWEINDLHREGHFRLLTGSEPLEDGFMDLNPATIMAARTMAHERAVARRTWTDFTKQFGVAVDPAKMQGTRQAGTDIKLKDGSIARFYQTKDGMWGVEQNGLRFRPLRTDIQGLANNPIIDAMGDSKTLFYHDDVARAIEDVAHTFDEPNELLKMLDTVTGLWKSTTLAHPSWLIGNVIGDTVNQLTGGARISDMAKDAPALARIMANANDPEKLATMTINVRGVDVRGDQLINDLREHGLMGTNAVAETALQMNQRGHFILPSLVGGAESRGFLEQFKPSVLKADFKERLSHELAAKRVAAGARAAGFVARDRFVRNVLRPWFRMNERTNDFIKALAYLSYLRQGNDIPSAVNRTIRAGFDYTDATRIERDYFKRMWPFYSFMRLNGAYQVKLLLTRPIYAGAFPLLNHAVEEAINGDASVPLHARPNWMRQQMALQVGSDPNERFALLLGNLLPQEQAFAALGAAKALTGDQQALADTAKYLVGSINPVIRTPLEIGAGREFFSDRTIGGDALEADLTPASALVNQVRPLRELPKLVQTFGEQGAGAGLARAIIGGRVQPMSDERIKVSRLREFQEKERRLQTAIRRAERAGDTGSRAEANLRLGLLYKSMIQAGLESDVPRWARERLSDTLTAKE